MDSMAFILIMISFNVVFASVVLDINKQLVNA